LVSPFCQENDSDMRGSGERISTSKSVPHRSDATPPKAAEFEEKSALISDMSRLIAEKLERRSGISSSDRLRMPLDKDRNAANLTSGGSSQGSGHNSSSANGNCPRDDPKFEKWREQLLSWQHAKLQKLHEFRQQQDETMAQSIQTKPRKLDVSGDLFFRKQLDKQMRHEQALESATSATFRRHRRHRRYRRHHATSATSASSAVFFGTHPGAKARQSIHKHTVTLLNACSRMIYPLYWWMG